MSILRGGSLLFLARVASQAISFGAIVVFTQTLSQAEIGIYFLFHAFLYMVGEFSDLGVRGALEKRVSEEPSASGVLTSALGIKLVIIGLTSLGALALGGYIESYLGKALVVHFVVALAGKELFGSMVHLLRAEHKLQSAALMEFGQRALWAGFSLVFIERGYNSEGLVLGLILSYFLMAAVGGVLRSTALSVPTRSDVSSIFEYSKYNSIANVGGYVYKGADTLLIGFFLTQADVASYEVVWRLVGMIALLSTIVGSSIFPYISSWHSDGDYEEIERTVRVALLASLFFVIPALAGVAIFGKEILTIAFGSEYAGAWLVFVVLSAEKLSEGVSIILRRCLQAIDRPGPVARAVIYSTVVNVLLNIVLIQAAGLLGAAIATTTASVLATVLYYMFLQSEIAVRVPVRKVAWLVVSAIVMTVALLAVDSFVDVQSFYELVTVVLFAVVTYVAATVVNVELREDIRDALSKVL